MSFGWTVSWCISLLVHWLVPIYFWSNLASYRYASGQMSVMRWFCSFRMFWASIEGLSFVRFMQIFSFILRLSLDRNMKLFNLQSNSNDQCVNTFFVIFGQIQLLQTVLEGVSNIKFYQFFVYTFGPKVNFDK